MEGEKLTGGSHANKQGRVLEKTIVPCLQSQGFEVVRFSDWKKHPTKFGDELVLRDVPYTTIYGHPGRTEFLIQSKRLSLNIRVECKWQQSSGSVDEKLPYLYLNCLEAVPENEVIIVIGGGGMKKGALAWLKAAVDSEKYVSLKHPLKKIHIFSLEEFLLWANTNLRN